jgi:hypothetical protein
MYSVKDAGLMPGMYIIRITNSESYGTVKVLMR